ncbi:uncharacterized protein DS421_9g273590 [Arachis hypogaea]|nr:uncharacterized protein DS421_9g273590 [Arachis hypogaea]
MASPEESLAPPPPLFVVPSSLACAVASRARRRRAVRESHHVSAVAGSHVATCSLPLCRRWKIRARQFCLSLPPPSELLPWPPKLWAEFLPHETLLPSPGNHRRRSQVAAATGGGCWGYHPTGSEAVAVRFSRSFLVSKLESEFTWDVEAISTIEKDTRNRDFDC